MSDLGRVLVLAGGLSHERDVSLRSGRRVADALRSVGVEVEQRDVDANLVERLREDPPDAVFPVLHGVTGEDGALRQVLDLYGVPYVGADAAACRTAFDKPVASTMVGTAGLHTPASVVLGHDTFRELGAAALMAAVIDQVGLPLVVKPARGGSALGASIVRSAEELPSAMVNCYAYGPVALIEQYIDGTEVAVTVVDTGDGPRALPAVEIRPDSGFYDYEARYTAGATQFVVPARLDASVAGACAVRGCRGASGAGAAGSVPVRPGGRCGRCAVVPRGERGAGDDGDLAGAARRRGRGDRAGCAVPRPAGCRRGTLRS